VEASTVKLLPLLAKMGNYFKVGVDHYATQKGSGVEMSVETLAAFICVKMDSWSPLIAGKDVLDPETKAACARMLAGLIINLAK
jgi:hypothetical protein